MQHARGIRIHRAPYSFLEIGTARSLCYACSSKKWCNTTASGKAKAIAVKSSCGSSEEELLLRGREEEGRQVGAATAGSSSDSRKRGSVVGAVALIVGTSIGSGILALPQLTAPAGFIPSAVCMIICWTFLVVEALLLAEINVYLRRKRRKKKDETKRSRDLQVISIRSMAQETLGEWGGNLATTTYLFMCYTCMVAYTAKSGEVLSRLIDVPEPVSGSGFTAAVALLVAGGGTGVTDRVNQLLTFFMIGLLLTIEVSAVAFGGGLSLPANSNWEQVPATLPVIIFTLVFHDISPVICAYLGGDIARIRLSIFLGSLVPLLCLLVWDDIALSLSTNLDRFDILDMLKTEWSYTVVETFSLLAVGTSLIGTLLGASQFFIEQLTNLASLIGPSIERHENMTDQDIVAFPEDDGSSHLVANTILDSNRLSYIATSLVVLPTMLIAATVPNSFSIATDVAGGYCMTVLYGVLPPLMAWAMSFKLSDPNVESVQVETSKGGKGEVELSSAKPVLVGVGVFSVILVFEQILQDLVSLSSYLSPSID